MLASFDDVELVTKSLVMLPILKWMLIFVVRFQQSEGIHQYLRVEWLAKRSNPGC
jgi:hypothetical protein